MINLSFSWKWIFNKKPSIYIISVTSAKRSLKMNCFGDVQTWITLLTKRVFGLWIEDLAQETENFEEDKIKKKARIIAITNFWNNHNRKLWSFSIGKFYSSILIKENEDQHDKWVMMNKWWIQIIII